MDESKRLVIGGLAIKKSKAKLHDKQISVRGRLELVLTGEDGRLKDKREYTNTITSAYDALIAECMVKGEAQDTLIDYTAIGTTTGGKSTASTLLEAEVARVQNDSNLQGAGAADNDVVHVSTFGAGVGTGALVEAGLFDSAGATTVTLMAYQDFAVINKGAGDTLTVTWTITYGAS